MENNIYLISFFISFVLTAVFLIFFIPILKKIKIGQIIRLEGPINHYRKKGTPTIGGIVFGISIVSTIFIINEVYNVYSQNMLLIIVLPLFLYMTIGFIDDILKIIKKDNEGLTPSLKIVFELLGIVIYYFLFLENNIDTKINFFGQIVDLKWGYTIFIILIFIASTNAVNLSDGLDGLASGLSIISLLGIMIIARVKEKEEIVIFCIIVISALISFLIFNFHPAKIFMGDTGSLMLGAIIANLMILLEEELLLIVIGICFVIEALSVILQVCYFKITKGKRMFLMSPLHHHFELNGAEEVYINLLFWLIALIGVCIGLLIIL